MAGPTFVQGAVNSDGAGTGVATLAQAFGSNNVTGNAIAVIVTSFDTRANLTNTSVSDAPGGGASNKYSLVGTFVNVASGCSIHAYLASNIKAGANTVTVNWGTGGGDFPDLWIVETTSAIFDAVGFGGAASGGTAQGMSATVVPVASNDLIIETGIVGSHITAAEAGYTQKVPGAGIDNNGAFLATKAGAAVGSQAVTMSQNTSDIWAMVALALQSSAANCIFFGSD